MTNAQLCESSGVHLTQLLHRYATATTALSPDQINVRPSGCHWSIAEITEHLHLACSSYLPHIEGAMSGATGGAGGNEAKQTFLGKLIEYGAGPRKSSPAPRVLYPKPGPYSVDSLESFSTDHSRLKKLVAEATDMDLSRLTIRNPFMKMFHLNLVDCFRICTAHSERHVGQVETISKIVR